MEDQQATAEPSQQFENIDFNSSPDDNKESSHNEEQEQVFIFSSFLEHVIWEERKLFTAFIEKFARWIFRFGISTSNRMFVGAKFI